MTAPIAITETIVDLRNASDNTTEKHVDGKLNGRIVKKNETYKCCKAEKTKEKCCKAGIYICYLTPGVAILTTGATLSAIEVLSSVNGGLLCVLGFGALVAGAFSAFSTTGDFDFR